MPKGRYKDPNRKGWHNQHGRCNRYEDVIDALVANIEAGLTYEDACTRAGIQRDQLYNWLKDPQKSERLEKAKVEGKFKHLQRINAGEKTWQSSAWFLERRYREEFALTREKTTPPSVTVVFEDDEK
jgi:hypothetical protein